MIWSLLTCYVVKIVMRQRGTLTGFGLLAAQRVTLQALQALTDDELREMIPHIGPRALVRSIISAQKTDTGKVESNKFQS